ARLQPAGDLTPAAIAALRTYYQGRLDAALNVIAAAERMAATAAPTVTTPQPQPPPHREREKAPTLPSPPSGGGQERSWREFFADRSILILSYVGAFLLIVAPLLFELSAFSAVDSTARFAAVLTLNLVFGIAARLCLRLPAL